MSADLLPCSSPPPAILPPPVVHQLVGSDSVAAPPTRRAPVLVVEDNESFALTLACSLEFLGYPCHVAHSAEAALAILEPFHETLHCIILDLGLPDAPGSEFFQLVVQRWPSLRIILCTGQEETDIRQTHPSLGWSAFLHKPFPARNLQAILAALPQRTPSASSSLSPML